MTLKIKKAVIPVAGLGTCMLPAANVAVGIQDPKIKAYLKALIDS